MKKPTIDYEHLVFDLEVKNEGKLSRLSSHEVVDILQVPYFIHELRDKHFDVFIFNRDSPWKENISFKKLAIIAKNNTTNNINEIKVRDHDNIVSFSLGEVNILLKDSGPFKEVLRKDFKRKFDYAADFEGYPDFIDFFVAALGKGMHVVEDEEFPGTLLKFMKGKKLIKAVYIQDGKFEFLDSYSEKYKDLQFENIKESLEKVNEKLKLEGKKPLGLEWKDE